MSKFNRIGNIVGWAVFAIILTVYFFSAERTGSLWDCGEFITGAYKLEVVHPPGAPLFMLVGRMFAWAGDLVSDDPADIAFAVNILSCICTAFTAMFIAWVTMLLGKLSLVGREDAPDDSQNIALAASGIVAGLATGFCSSIWFSGVEGEVYAMSTFFTALTLWAMIKWYGLPDTPYNDRWIVFAIFASGLSLGVHLLSLLTFPALALFYYFKKYKNHTWTGMAISVAAGVAFIVIVQALIIVGIPSLWGTLELLMVNGFGLPFHSGLIPLLLVVGGIIYFLLQYAHKNKNAVLQQFIIASTLVVIGFSTFGIIVIRAASNTPINMNDPSDAMRLIPYLNREQYGERSLLFGHHFEAGAIRVDREERYGRVGEKYEVTDEKVTAEYNKKDKMLFQRLGDNSGTRAPIYKQWLGLNPREPLPPGRPNQGDNISFLFKYQIHWMYWRYFMWNFSGRQNGEQGYFPWDPKSGNWLTGFNFIDNWRLFNQNNLPDTMENNKARNRYFMLPFLFGLLGLLYHYKKRKNDFIGVLALFVITGIGIIIYTNQPPNEPRERDYVLAASFFTYCIWMGMGVLALFEILKERAKLSGQVAGGLAGAIVLIAPLLMGFQNFDDHSRMHHSGSRDYAANFLESCEPNAIIFTYGDNDTYPLWYAQETEGIRTDVRVVNLSLIAVDWYIDQLRRKVNESPAIDMTIPREAYRGFKRNQLFVDPGKQDQVLPLDRALQFVGEDHPVPTQGGKEIESYVPARKLFIPVNKQKALEMGMFNPKDSVQMVGRMDFTISGNYVLKGDIAVLDIISSNIWKRPIYFAVTVQTKSLLGLGAYLQLEGLGQRIVPVKSPKDRQVPSVAGLGRVDSDRIYDNMMNKFRWGNFDKKDLFVDRSYAPSVQSQRFVMMRGIQELLRRGDKKRAIELTDKHFEAFPHMNFPYGFASYTLTFIQFYMQAGAHENAKKHLRILANEILDQLQFMDTLDAEDLAERNRFKDDFTMTIGTKDNVLRLASQVQDAEFLKEMQEMFVGYSADKGQLKK